MLLNNLNPVEHELMNVVRQAAEFEFKTCTVWKLWRVLLKIANSTTSIQRVRVLRKAPKGLCERHLISHFPPTDSHGQFYAVSCLASTSYDFLSQPWAMVDWD